MKSAIAPITLALLVTPAWAYHQNSNHDLQQGIANVHDSHFPHADGDSHEPERGAGDLYGSLLLDPQAGEAHMPHQAGDSHAPEKRSGDAYGSVLND
jgi:hypothetical protein